MLAADEEDARALECGVDGDENEGGREASRMPSCHSVAFRRQFEVGKDGDDEHSFMVGVGVWGRETSVCLPITPLIIVWRFSASLRWVRMQMNMHSWVWGT